MDLYEAIGLLGLESFIGADITDYTSKDVEKCFRQQALLHHPDKGGDASYFQLLQTAKTLLLDHNVGKTMGMGNAYCKVNDTNSTALSTSLYEHRTCVRQVLVLHGKSEAVIAATDDGLIVVELKKDANFYLSGGLQRIVSFKTHVSFLCCAACPTDPADTLYAGAKDGFVHKIDLMTRTLTPWQLPSRERILAISVVRDWVAIATADGGIYIFEYKKGSSKPTMLWKDPMSKDKGVFHKKGGSIDLSPEVILLEEGPSSNCLNLWVGGSSSDNVTGKLVMWELDIREDLSEEYESEMEDLFSNYDFYDSDTENDSEDQDGCNDQQNIRAIDVVIEEGAIFSLSKHKSTVAVTAGQYILVWDYQKITSSKKLTHKFTKIKTIQTNNRTLYTLCMNERYLAAAGSGESIMVWDRDLWTMLHYLPLPTPPSGCCLATNCIMSLDWFNDNSGILVSGGYDGVVTLWTLANRLKR